MRTGSLATRSVVEKRARKFPSIRGHLVILKTIFLKGKYSVFFTSTLQNLIRFLNESEDLSFSAFPFTDQVDQSSKNKHMTDDEHPIPIYLQISSQGLPLFLGGIITMYWVLRNLKDQSQQNNEIPSTLHRLLYWPACCYTECKK